MNPGEWWNQLGMDERARWLDAHRLKVSWARFEWRRLQPAEQARILCCKWNGEDRAARREAQPAPEKDRLRCATVGRGKTPVIRR